MKQNNLRIAIQKEGRLRDESLKFLENFGLIVDGNFEGKLTVECKRLIDFPNLRVEIMFVRHKDVPQYVKANVADFGIVGSNVLYENGFDVKVVTELDFGKCDLVLAVPDKSFIRDLSDIQGERIATSYPNSLKRFLSQNNVSASIVEIAGSVEIAPKFGLADAICDLVKTGKTLSANGLKPFLTIYKSRALLISSSVKSKTFGYEKIFS